MNPFKPRRSFESVVRELVTGLQEGSIVLDKKVEELQAENKKVSVEFSAMPRGIKVAARLFFIGFGLEDIGFISEYVIENVASSTRLTIDFSNCRSLPIRPEPK